MQTIKEYQDVYMVRHAIFDEEFYINFHIIYGYMHKVHDANGNVQSYSMSEVAASLTCMCVVGFGTPKVQKRHQTMSSCWDTLQVV